MLAFTARVLFRQKEEARTRPLSRFVEVIEEPAATGTLRPAAGDEAQASLFSRIFKEDIPVKVLHSSSPLAQYLARHSALGATERELKR
jgi:hypothetical protein